MQKAEVVLSILNQKSKANRDYVFERLYRHLFNKDIYQSIKCNLSNEIIDEMIQLLKDEKFYPKENCKCTDVLEKVIIKILKAVYGVENFILEELEADTNRNNIHNILITLKKEYKTGDTILRGFISIREDKKIDFDINHLTRKISDGRLLELIKRIVHSKHTKGTFFDQLIQILALDFDEIIEESDLFSNNNFNIKYYRIGVNFVIIGGRKFLQDALKVIKKYNTNESINFETECVLNNETETSKRAELFGYKPILRKSGALDFIMPDSAVNKALKPFLKDNKPTHCSNRVNYTVISIIKQYNNDLSNFCEYYRVASNFERKLRKFMYFHYISLAKTIALKEKISVSKVFKKYSLNIKNAIAKKSIGVTKFNSGVLELTYYGIDN